MQHAALAWWRRRPHGRGAEGTPAPGSLRRSGLAAILLIAALASQPAPAGKTETAKKPGFEDGPLPSVSKIVKNILRLKFQGENLRLDRSQWDKPLTITDSRGQPVAQVQRNVILRGVAVGGRGFVRIQGMQIGGGSKLAVLFQQLRAAAGSGNFSSGSTGRQQQMSFTGQRLSASLTHSEDSLRFRIQEETAPSRTLELRASETGSLRITLVCPDAGVVVLFDQAEAGQVKLLHVAGSQVRRAEERTFLSYYRKNRRYVEDELLALLDHVGVGMAATPDSPRVAAAVLARLRSLAGRDEAADAARLIEQLASDSYAQRQQATQALSAEYSQYARYIQKALKDPASSPETISRLKKIVADNQHREPTARLVASLDLPSDAEYLVGLLEKTTGSDRDLVAARLELVTKQKLGTDVKAWRKYLEGRSSKPPEKTD